MKIGVLLAPETGLKRLAALLHFAMIATLSEPKVSTVFGMLVKLVLLKVFALFSSTSHKAKRSVVPSRQQKL